MSLDYEQQLRDKLMDLGELMHERAEDSLSEERATYEAMRVGIGSALVSTQQGIDALLAIPAETQADADARAKVYHALDAVRVALRLAFGGRTAHE